MSALQEEVVSQPAAEKITGVLFRVDTKALKFKLDPDEGEQPLNGNFLLEQLDELKMGLRHRVELELSLREVRHAYSRTPFQRQVYLLRVVEVFEDD